MVSQYVFPSNRGLFRIVRHGRRWRSLVEDNEVARHDSPDAALDALRAAWPQARLPQALRDWRYVAPVDQLAHAGHGMAVRGTDSSQPRMRRSRHRQGWPNRGAVEHG